MRSSLFARIFALVLATLVVAQLTSLALLAMIPPVPSQSIPISLVVAAVARPGGGSQLQSRPVADPEYREARAVPAAVRIEADIAGRLGLSAGSVRLDLSPLQRGKIVSVIDGSDGALQPALLGHFVLYIRSDAGGWTRYEPRDRAVFDSREQRFILLFLASALAMLPIVWLFAKRMAAPFAQFAEAAERLGRDPAQAPPAIDGPAEVARAARAFAGMQARLAAYVKDRTELLAAIAHDLRTPLTRLAFRIESLDEAQRDALAGDVQEMAQMVAATMDFARGAHEGAVHQRLELGSLVERVAEDMRLVGRKVTAEALETLVVDGDPLGLRRLFTNLFDNGEKFGGCAHARIFRNGDMAIVEIEDAGPGVPPGSEEAVFEPFFRLEPSRSRDTGGIGLGLSVVRSIARAHGGDVVLANRMEGGASARVMLPLASAS